MKHLLLLIALLTSSAFGQVNVGIKSNRKNFIAYEPIRITVNLQNLAGQPLSLHNSFDRPWIEFVVTDHSGEVISPIEQIAYPAVSIPTGQAVSSTFLLNNAFDFSNPGNYSCYAIVRTPNDGDKGGSRSQNIHFSISRGLVSWQQKVGVPGVQGEERAYRIINSAGDGTPYIYVQVEDTKRGRMLATYSMGKHLAFRKSIQMIDNTNNLHVLFQITPQLHCHTVVATSGKTIRRQYHKAGEVGIPQLVSAENGQIDVANSIPYDPVKAAEENAKFHNLSEIPGGIEQ